MYPGPIFQSCPKYNMQTKKLNFRQLPAGFVVPYNFGILVIFSMKEVVVEIITMGDSGISKDMNGMQTLFGEVRHGGPQAPVLQPHSPHCL